ncbi:MAG: YiiD C-terminal domain-containing protein [Pirellulales bacterium]
MHDDLLSELQTTIERQIPMCAHIGIRVHSYGEHGLTLRAPLERNRNHQQTAFAGSLNALCTVSGWGTVFLLARRHGMSGDIVIRRSAIKYLKPVECEHILATCGPVDPAAFEHFLAMFHDKGQAKIELRSEIHSGEDLAVTFIGSYVVLGRK